MQQHLTEAQAEVLASTVVATLRALLLTESAESLRKRFGQEGKILPLAEVRRSPDGSDV
jgi:hypothetical protein